MADYARRVRALLAKADSTTFPAEEAELRRKAHELMARHGISQADVAALEDRRPPAPRPSGPVVVRIVFSTSPFSNGMTGATATGSYSNNTTFFNIRFTR